MGYQINDNGSSITISNGLGQKTIHKTSIVGIAVKGNSVRIDSGDCTNTIVLHPNDITNLYYPDANALADGINGMMSSYICYHGPDGDQDGGR